MRRPWGVSLLSTQVIARRLHPAGDSLFHRPLASASRHRSSGPTPPRVAPHRRPTHRTRRPVPRLPPAPHRRFLPTSGVHTLGRSVSSFESPPTGSASTPRTRLASGSTVPPLRATRPLRHLSSGPFSVRCPVRSSLCTQRFPWSRGIFDAHRVIPRGVALVTEILWSSTGKSQVVHRRRVDASSPSGLNGGVISFARPSATLVSIIIIR